MDNGRKLPPPNERWKIDPYLMSVISSRLEAIIGEMTKTVAKASRSAVIKNARDLSCGVLTYDHRQLSIEEGIPIHISALDLTTRAVTDYFDDVKEGDVYINNCAYTGGTHHADITLIAPVFCDGEPMFWALARAHHADVGAPLPTTYLPRAATVYEEGLNIPSLRIQENYKDRGDLIRMFKMNIRCPNVWYGDYKAQIGACRIGERRLKELVERYGKQTIKAFVEEWMAYGERRMISEIRKLPAGSWTYETRHDPVPGVCEDGVPVRVKLTIDPENAYVTVDLRDNIDQVPGGINLSEACSTGSARIGVYFNVDPHVPHNAGSDSRIKVLLRDGSAVGRPTYPAGTSIATTNVNERLVNAVQACFAQLGAPYGLAEGCVMQQLGMAVISGKDPNNGNEEYINQLFVGYGGGPGRYGMDGWITYLGPVNAGMLLLDSVEIDESMYPIVVNSRKIAVDSFGPGEWNGAPGMTGEYHSLADTMMVTYCSDGCLNVPQGVLGGWPAKRAHNIKRLANGDSFELPAFHEELVKRGESVIYVANGGGGYGEPTRRSPALVAKDVNRGWLSVERAAEAYRVALTLSDDGIEYSVDPIRTEELRRNGRSSSR